MAYTFNNINGLLGPDEEKANIFAPGGSDANLPQNQAGGQGNASGGTVKTDTGTDLGSVSGPTGSSSGAGSPKTQAQTNQTDILEKNQFQQDPGFATELQGNIQKGQAALQDEANSYTAAQDSKGDARLSNSDIDSAIGGDDGANSSVRNYLTSPVAADAFSSAVNTDYGNLDQLGDANSLAGYLQTRGGQNYNRGMAGLDASLLSRDAGFQQGVSQARAQRDALQAMSKNYQGGSLQSQAQDYINTHLAEGQNQAKDYLGTKASDIQNSVSSAVQAENAARAQDRLSGYDAQKSKVQDVINQIKAEHPELAQYLVNDQGLNNLVYTVPNPGGGDYANPSSDPNLNAIHPQDYFHVAGDLGANDLTTADQAGQFNRIQSLLGTKNLMVAGGGMNARDSFDTEKLKSDLLAKSGTIKDAIDKANADKAAAEQQASEDTKNNQNTQVSQKSNAVKEKILGDKGLHVPAGILDASNNFETNLDKVGGLSHAGSYTSTTSGGYPNIQSILSGITGGGDDSDESTGNKVERGLSTGRW